MKHSLHSGTEPNVYFWRTSRGVEVDVVTEQHGRLVPVEVKQTSTPRPPMADGLRTFLDDYRSKTDRGWLVHLGDHTLPLAPNITAIPFAEL